MTKSTNTYQIWLTNPSTALVIFIILLITVCFSRCGPIDDSSLITGDCDFEAINIIVYPNPIVLLPNQSVELYVQVGVNSNCSGYVEKIVVSGSTPIPDDINITTCEDNQPVSNSGACSITVQAEGDAAPGTYDLTVSATVINQSSGESETNSIIVPLQILEPDFSLTIPETFGAGQGLSFTVTTTINRTGGFADDISLSLDHIPLYLTYTFDPNPVTINDTTSQLTISPAQSTPDREYSMELLGTVGNIVRDAIFTFHVLEPFHPTLNPDNITIAQGQSGSVTVNANRLAVFFDPVFFTAEGNIIGPGNDLIEPVFDPNGTTEHSVELTLHVGSEVPVGTYNIIIAASFDTMRKTVELPVTVIE